MILTPSPGCGKAIEKGWHGHTWMSVPPLFLKNDLYSKLPSHIGIDLLGLEFPVDGNCGSQKQADPVTGIYEDLPENASVRPEYILTLSSIEHTKNRPDFRNQWCGDYRVYVLLNNGADELTVNKKIENLFAGYNYYEHEHLYLLPLTNHHLKSSENDDYMIAIFLYGLMGVFALLLSSIIKS